MRMVAIRDLALCGGTFRMAVLLFPLPCLDAFFGPLAFEQAVEGLVVGKDSGCGTPMSSPKIPLKQRNVCRRGCSCKRLRRMDN